MVHRLSPIVLRFSKLPTYIMMDHYGSSLILFKWHLGITFSRFWIDWRPKWVFSAKIRIWSSYIYALFFSLYNSQKLLFCPHHPLVLLSAPDHTTPKPHLFATSSPSFIIFCPSMFYDAIKHYTYETPTCWEDFLVRVQRLFQKISGFWENMKRSKPLTYTTLQI